MCTAGVRKICCFIRRSATCATQVFLVSVVSFLHDRPSAKYDPAQSATQCNFTQKNAFFQKKNHNIFMYYTKNHTFIDRSRTLRVLRFDLQLEGGADGTAMRSTRAHCVRHTQNNAHFFHRPIFAQFALPTRTQLKTTMGTMFIRNNMLLGTIWVPLFQSFGPFRLRMPRFRRNVRRFRKGVCTFRNRVGVGIDVPKVGRF